MEIIETERLIIREIESRDIDCLLRIYQDSKNMEFIPNSNKEWTAKLLSEKYEKLNCNYRKGFGVYAVSTKKSDILIGEAGFFDSFQDATHLELGYILDNRYWGNGYGTEVCRSLIDYGFNNLRLGKITARMFSENIASIRLSEKCGMIFIRQGLTSNNESFCEYEITSNKRLDR